MLDEGVQLVERPGVEEDVQPFPGGELALGVLALDLVGAAALAGDLDHIQQFARFLTQSGHGLSPVPG